MKSPLLALLKPFLIFLVGLLDDALLIAFSRIGLHVSWLQWLAPIVLGVTLLHCIGQFGQFLYRQVRYRQVWYRQVRYRQILYRQCRAQMLTSSSNCFSKVKV